MWPRLAGAFIRTCQVNLEEGHDQSLQYTIWPSILNTLLVWLFYTDHFYFRSTLAQMPCVSGGRAYWPSPSPGASSPRQLLQPYHSLVAPNTTSTMVSSRLRIQYCKVIIATSLVWFLLDVFLLMYFTDCTLNNNASCDKGKIDPRASRTVTGTSKLGIIGMLIPGKSPLTTNLLVFHLSLSYLLQRASGSFATVRLVT